MVSLKRSVIVLLLITGTILTQSVLALSLPTGAVTSGVRPAPFGINAFVEFGVYDNKGLGLTSEGFDLPFSEANTKEYVYVYKIFHNDVPRFGAPFFSISGIGENAIGSDPQNYIGHLSDPADAEEVEPGSETFVSNTEVNDEGKYVSSVYWDFFTGFDSNPWSDGDHSSLLMITSDHPWQEGTYGFFEKPVSLTNPEPCTLALFGLGSILLLKRQRKK